jgi:hypothetical protein
MPPLPEERSSGTQHSDPAAAGFPAGNDEGAAAPMSGDADWQATPSPSPEPLPAPPQVPAASATDDASGWQSSPSLPAPRPDAEPVLKPFAPASEAPRAKFETMPEDEPAVDAEGGSRLR